MRCLLAATSLAGLGLLSGCTSYPAYKIQDSFFQTVTGQHYYSPQQTLSMQGEPMPFPSYQPLSPAYHEPEATRDQAPVPPQVLEPVSTNQSQNLDMFTQCVRAEAATGNYPSNDGGHAMLRMIGPPRGACLNSRMAWINDCESKNDQNGVKNADCTMNSALYAMIILKMVDGSLGNR